MWKKIILSIIVILLITSGWLAYSINNEFIKLESDDPEVWESVIKDFEIEDKNTKHHEDAILFIGSSSIRFWYSLQEDMAPLPVIKRGFGGAKLNDVSYYADRVIFPYQPKKIVLFAGTNDISGRPNDKSPKKVLVDFKILIGKIKAKLPNTTVYFLPITPTISRREIWPQANKANQLIKAFIKQEKNIIYIDTTKHFIDNEGNLNEDLIWFDGIHLSKKGYKVWTKLIKDQIVKNQYNGQKQHIYQ